MGKIKTCPDCNRDFGIIRWRHECDLCKKTKCGSCSESQSFNNVWICEKCLNIMSPSISKMKLVASSHVGGHSIAKKYAEVTASNWFRDRQNAIDDIKYQAYRLGANSIVNFRIEKDTKREHGSGNGIHYYSVFCTYGNPAVVKKKYYRQTEGKSISEEIEKLVELNKKGHISNQEFIEAKKKIIQ